MGYNAYDNMALQFASYGFECALIGYTFIASNIKHNNINTTSVVIVAVIILFNYLISPNEPEYSDLIKYVGYLGCFIFGDYLARNYDVLKVHNIWLYSIIIIPAILVAFFDDTILKNMFFRTPNGFVYLGVAIGAFYLLIKGRQKKYLLRATLISGLYILICTSLGVVVAALLTYTILNLKRKHLPYLILGIVAFLMAVFFIDIPLFVRIRDVFTVWRYVYDNNGLANIQNVDFVEINKLDQKGERTDSASSIWRIVHWIGIFKLYVEQIWTIPFGMGAGFSVKTTGLYPHNDYLLILSEYGLVVFCFFFKFLANIYRRLKNENFFIYFILTMLLYHFTENLLNNFPPGAILYVIIGWSLRKYGTKYVVNS